MFQASSVVYKVLGSPEYPKTRERRTDPCSFLEPARLQSYMGFLQKPAKESLFLGS